MKIVFTSQGNMWDSIIDPRIGRTKFILLFDEDGNDLIAYDNSTSVNVAHGAGTATAQKVLELSPDILITGNMLGENALLALKQLNLKIYIGAGNMTIKSAFENYKDGKLTLI